MSPAKISRVTIIDPLARHLEVIVEETQLSLAIGKKGQNVRLAAKLMGWRIDIKSEDEKRQEVETAMAAMGGAGTPVSVLLEHNLSESLVDKLLDAGSSTIESLADMTPEQLEEIPGIGPKMVEKITQAVSDYFSQFETSSPAAEPLDRDDEDAAASETEAPAHAPKAPAVMPGLPVEGADVDDEFDDEDIDFDTMDEGSSFPPDTDVEAEDEIVDPDAASIKARPQSARAVDSATPAEDDVHDNLTAKESQQS